MTQSPSTQTFYPKQRGTRIVQGLIFLLFSGSCIYQSVLRYRLDVDKFWNSWWFFALLSVGCVYFAVEAFYKIFFTRLVLSTQEVIVYDFPRARRVDWIDIQRVGEIDYKGKKKDIGFLLKESALEKDGIPVVPIISLTPFFSSWNESPIKQWLKEKKPHLVI